MLLFAAGATRSAVAPVLAVHRGPGARPGSVAFPHRGRSRVMGKRVRRSTRDTERAYRYDENNLRLPVGTN